MRQLSMQPEASSWSHWWKMARVLVSRRGDQKGEVMEMGLVIALIHFSI
jgi:hypothetical protein